MWMPSFNQTLDSILVLALVVSVCYILRLRANSDKSKASFALSLVTSMATLTALFVKTITGSEQSKVQTLLFDIVDKETGWSLSPGTRPERNRYCRACRDVFICNIFVLQNRSVDNFAVGGAHDVDRQ
jgi:hypothetical protein